MNTFQCATCGNVYSAKTEGGTGYGYDRERLHHCYHCCAVRDIADMAQTGRATMYLTDAGVTNWPGSLRFKALGRRPMHHPFAKAEIAYFDGPDGRLWSAKRIGGMDVCHCRRVKGRAYGTRYTIAPMAPALAS